MRTNPLNQHRPMWSMGEGSSVYSHLHFHFPSPEQATLISPQNKSVPAEIPAGAPAMMEAEIAADRRLLLSNKQGWRKRIHLKPIHQRLPQTQISGPRRRMQTRHTGRHGNALINPF